MLLTTSNVLKLQYISSTTKSIHPTLCCRDTMLWWCTNRYILPDYFTDTETITQWFIQEMQVLGLLFNFKVSNRITFAVWDTAYSAQMNLNTHTQGISYKNCTQFLHWCGFMVSLLCIHPVAVLQGWLSVLYDLAFHSVIVKYIIPIGSVIFITLRLLQSLPSLQQRRMELSENQRHVHSDTRRNVWLSSFWLCSSYATQAYQ